MSRSIGIIALFLCVFGHSAYATTIRAMTAEELVPISEFVGRIEIVSGERLLLEEHGERIDCGYKLVADVVEALKGNEAQKVFVSESPLELGSDYLVYLSSVSLGAPVVMSTNWLMIGALEEERNERAMCMESFPFPRSPVLTSSKFETYLYVYDRGYDELEWWIRSSESLSDHSDEIDAIYVVAETVGMERNGVTTIMADSEFLKRGSAIFEGEVAEYPLILLDEGLMKWADVKAVLLRLIAEAEERKWR